MSIFKKKEQVSEKPHVVGDGCKRCRNYNLEYCKGKDRCCEAFKPFEDEEKVGT